MKLTCDLCGGELEVTAKREGAVCRHCGMGHPQDRLREKLQEQQRCYDPQKTTAVCGKAQVHARASAKKKPGCGVGVFFVILALIVFLDSLLVEDPLTKLVIFLLCAAATVMTIFVLANQEKRAKQSS